MHEKEDNQGDAFLFHYTSISGLNAMLESATMRLSPRERMNDPRENRKIRDDYQVAFDPIYIGSLGHELDTVTTEWAFARGFARARSWDQYGDRHRGACLVFRRKELVDALNLWVDSRGPRTLANDCFASKVRYIDRGIPSAGQAPNEWITSGGSGPRSSFEEVARHDPGVREALMLTKNLNWATEREFRLLVWGPVDKTDEATWPRIPIQESLTAVIYGMDSAVSELNTLAARLARGLFTAMHSCSAGGECWG